MRSSLRLSFPLLACFSTLLCVTSAWGVELRGLARLGADFGGDPVITLGFTDGSQQRILAGQGLTISGGVASEVFQSGDHAIDVQLQLGVKLTTMARTTNASLEWLRWPVDLLAFYKFTPWHLRVGLGPTFHFANHFEGSGAISSAVYDFQPALGGVVQVDYTLGQNFNLELRCSLLGYTRAGAAASLNASSLGFGFSYIFEIIKPTAAAEGDHRPER